jgi:hypothetical protein
MHSPKQHWFIWLSAILCGLSLVAQTGLVAAQEEPPLLPSAIPVTPINPVPNEEQPLMASPAGNTATSQTSPSSEPTAGTGTPDTCEPNNTADTACLLPLDAVSGPFTIVPEDDQDFYALDLPAEPAIQTAITVRASDGLDLRVTTHQTTTLIASGTSSLTIPAAMSGRVVLRVEQRGAGLAANERYRIEVRREIAPAQEQPISDRGGDALENNWSPATAHPIAVGVVYDLSLVCPEIRPDACLGGDHDYLLVPLKGGVPYLMATFDLAPGVDTVIELFWHDASVLTVGNDDYAPGGLLSGLTYTPPTDGLALVRVAPRNGGLANRSTLDGAATYRFAITPTASELATKVRDLLQQQANLPTPTSTLRSASPPPAGGSAPAPAPSRPVGNGPAAQQTSAVKENIERGPAIVLRATDLRREPRANADLVAPLAPEQVVELRGPVIGMWVSVESATSLLPGWVLGTDLQRLPPDVAAAMTARPAASVATTTAMTSGTAAAASSTRRTTVAATSTATPPVVVAVQVLDPALPPPLPTAAPRVAIALTVQVAIGTPPVDDARFGGPTPTPDVRQPLAAVHVQLVNAFGDVLAEARTDAQGQVRLSRDVGSTDAVWVRLPAWGVDVPVDPAQTALLITLPEVDQ